MAVKIKLKRMGKVRSPHYRIIVADARAKRDGRAIEEIGKYHPKENPSLIDVKSERAQYWLGVGAQPTEPVVALLKVTGDWQKFKGLPGAEGTLRSAEPKADKSEKYNALLAEVHKDDDKSGAGAKKRTAKKSAAKKTAKSADKPEEKSADKSDAKAKPEDKADSKADDKAKPDGEKPAKKSTAKKTAAKSDDAASEAKADDTKAETKTAAKKAPAKKAAAEKAPAKKTAAKKATAEDADASDDKADKADAPAEES